MSVHLQHLSEQQIKKLEDNLPGIDLNEVAELHALFAKFQRSDRFVFFRRIPLHTLSAEGWIMNGPAAVWTLEDMILRGAVDVCLLLELDADAIHVLYQTLSRLLAGDVSDDIRDKTTVSHVEQQPQPKGNENANASWERRNRNAAKDHSIPVYSSVEADRLLTEALKSLRDLSVSVLQTAKVSDFWNSEIISGPFLEELSFAELSELSAEHILKKRSFTGTKLHLLLTSIDSFLQSQGHAGSIKIESKASLQERNKGSIAERKIKQGNVIIFPYAQEAKLSLIEQGIVSLIERIVGSEIDENDSLCQTLEMLVEESFIFRLSSLLVSEYYYLDNGSESTHSKEGYVELYSLLEQNAPVFIKHLRTLLLGAGSEERLLLKEYHSVLLGDELSRILLRILLKAIGAYESRWRYSDQMRIWSMRSDALEHLEKALKARIVEDSSDAERFFRFLAPHLPESMLHDILRNS